MKLAEIAARIQAHLEGFESDPNINKRADTNRTLPYRCVGVYASGRYVAVTYVSFQGRTFLPKDVALGYLAWLDAGNIGTHWQYFNSRKAAS